MDGTFTVLVVDDEDDIRLLLSMNLRALHMEVVLAACAKSALRLADETHPQLVVLDNDLGEGPTGVDIAPLLKQVAPNAAIVLYSAAAPANSEVDFVIAKPELQQILCLAEELRNATLNRTAPPAPAEA